MNKQLSIFNFTLKNLSQGVTDIYIDGDIVDAPTQELYKEYWGDQTSVSYKSIRDQILQSESKHFNIYFNSGGGHVGDAMAMHDLFVDLQTNKGYIINTIGRGIIASAATYPLMASENSSITENSSFLIHNVSGGAFGNVTEMENYVAAMRKFNDQIKNFYAKKTGLSETVIGNMMDKETWLTGEETVTKGFVKNKLPSAEFSNAIAEDKWMFNNQDVLALYNSFTKNSNSNEMDLKKISDAIDAGFQNLATKLGLANKEDKATTEALSNFSAGIVNAVKELVPTQESITEMVNKAIETATEGDAAAIEDAITKGTEGLLNKTELEKELNDFKNEIVKAVGNKSAEQKEEKSTGPRNRFQRETYYEPKK